MKYVKAICLFLASVLLLDCGLFLLGVPKSLESWRGLLGLGVIAVVFLILPKFVSACEEGKS